MPRFPIAIERIKDGKATISGPDYKHIVRVLRLKPGDDIILFDESGIEYKGSIIGIDTKEVTVEVEESRRIETESRLNTTLLQGIPKGEKMDFIVEKATELGVKTIVPVITERSQVKHAEKIKRWQRIAYESLKQCGRIAPPEIHPTTTFDEAIKYPYYNSLKLIFYEKCKHSFKDDLHNRPQPPSNIILFIGPEGGFSQKEVRMAEDRGFIQMGLGPRILRTETAGIVALSILQFVYGDI